MFVGQHSSQAINIIKVTDKVKNIQWPTATGITDFPILAFDQDLTTCLEGAMDSPTLYFEEDSKKLSLNNDTTENDHSDLDGLHPSLELSFDLNTLIEASQTNAHGTQLFPEGVLLPETSLDLSVAEPSAVTSQMPVVVSFHFG